MWLKKWKQENRMDNKKRSNILIKTLDRVTYAFPNKKEFIDINVKEIV